MTFDIFFKDPLNIKGVLDVFWIGYNCVIALK